MVKGTSHDDELALLNLIWEVGGFMSCQLSLEELLYVHLENWSLGVSILCTTVWLFIAKFAALLASHNKKSNKTSLDLLITSFGEFAEVQDILSINNTVTAEWGNFVSIWSWLFFLGTTELIVHLIDFLRIDQACRIKKILLFLISELVSDQLLEYLLLLELLIFFLGLISMAHDHVDGDIGIVHDSVVNTVAIGPRGTTFHVSHICR